MSKKMQGCIIYRTYDISCFSFFPKTCMHLNETYDNTHKYPFGPKKTVLNMSTWPAPHTVIYTSLFPQALSFPHLLIRMQYIYIYICDKQ